MEPEDNKSDPEATQMPHKSSFLELFSKTSRVSEGSDYSETELAEGVLENPITRELLSLALQSVYEFKELIECVRESHGNTKELQDELQSMWLVLDQFELHFKVLIDVVAGPNRQNLQTILGVERYAPIRMHYDSTIDIPTVSPVIVEDTLKYIVKNLFMQLHLLLTQLNSPKKKLLIKSADAALDLQIIRSKMDTVMIYTPAMLQFKKDDLLTLPKNHPRWVALKSYSALRETASEAQIQKEYAMIYRVINVASATLQRGNEEKGIFKDIIHFSGPMYFWFFKEEADRIAKKGISNAKPEAVLQLWGLPDTDLVQNTMRIMLPHISTIIKFNIPRPFPQLTKEQLLLETQGEAGIELDQDLCAYLLKDAKRDFNTALKELTKKSKTKIEIQFLYHRNFKFGQKNGQPHQSDEQSHGADDLEETKTSNTNHTNSTPSPRRNSSILDHFNELKGNIQKLVDEGIDLMRSKPDPEMERELSEVIIHIHGGGFVSMSPDSHQNYTRRWANSTKRPVFSIDYRLAPENPFPAALDDCWQFYNWLLLFGKDMLGVPIKKIVLAGDSAGGNLITALTLKAIKSGIRVPDGLLMVYPALQLDANLYTPSFLNSMEDSMLSYSFLKLCVNAYVPVGYEARYNFYLSPLNAPDELLAKLPLVRLMIGEKDPLNDDCWRFLERMTRLNKDIRMYVYRHLPHAFLSYDHVVGYDTIIGDSIAMIKELFALANCDI